MHRAALLATAAVLVVDTALYLTGAVTARQALLLFLLVELPCTAVSLVATWSLLRRLRRAGCSRRQAVEEVFGAGPVRGAEAEYLALRAVVLFLLRRREPAGGVHIGYGKGLLGTVVAFLVLAAVETLVLHVLIPVRWVETALAVLSGYTAVLVLGLAVSRIVYPHHLADGRLHLRQGARTIARLDVRDVAAVQLRRRVTVVGLYPKVDGDRLHLPSQDGTNLDLALARPVVVPVGPTWRRRDEPTEVRHVSLHVDDPAAAVRLLTAARPDDLPVTAQ